MAGLMRRSGRSKLVAEEHEVYRHFRSKRFEYGYRNDMNLQGSRLQVSAELPSMGSDMRPVQQRGGESPSRMRRTSERMRTNQQAVPVVSVLGFRANVGVAVIGLILVATMFFCLWSHGRVSGMQKQLVSLSRQVESSKETLEATEMEYQDSIASINLTSSARELGMVSSKSVKPIGLQVPETAVIQPSEDPLELPVDYLATIMGY